MNKQEIEASILAFFKQDLNVEVPSPAFELIDGGILDSLMLVDLVIYIEQTYGTSISLEDLDFENFATVADMADFVLARQMVPASDPEQVA